MSQEESVITRSEDIKAKSDEASIYISQNGSNQLTICPSCGTRRVEIGDACVECGVIIEASTSGVAMVPCSMCDGSGTIFLNYLEGHALAEGNHEQRWLPCAECDGTGEIPRRVIVGRQKKELRKQLLVILLELLDGLTRR